MPTPNSPKVSAALSSRLSIVFDLDGTLVDTAPDLAAAMNAVLAEEGLSALPVSHVRHMVGRGARVLIETGFKAVQHPLDGARLDAMVAHFLEHYGRNIAASSRPFAGAREAVAALGAAGHRLGVCTNKPHALTLQLLQALDFVAPFAAIRGADAQPYRKPDPRHLLDVIGELGGVRERAVLVGDSETDVKTARAAGVPVIVVSFGYTEIAPEALGGDRLIGCFSELQRAVLELFPA